MPDILYELIMSWVFIGTVVVGLFIVLLGFRQSNMGAKLLRFGVGAALPVGMLLFLWIGTEA